MDCRCCGRGLDDNEIKRDKMDWKVGQGVWVVFKRGTLRYIEISKVGRKWVTLKNGYRFEKTKTSLDGGDYVSPGRIYESKQAYEDELQLRTGWEELRKYLDRIMPPDMTMERIRAARAALGIEDDPAPEACR